MENEFGRAHANINLNLEEPPEKKQKEEDEAEKLAKKKKEQEEEEKRKRKEKEAKEAKEAKEKEEKKEKEEEEKRKKQQQKEKSPKPKEETEKEKSSKGKVDEKPKPNAEEKSLVESLKVEEGENRSRSGSFTGKLLEKRGSRDIKKPADVLLNVKDLLKPTPKRVAEVQEDSPDKQLRRSSLKNSKEATPEQETPELKRMSQDSDLPFMGKRSKTELETAREFEFQELEKREKTQLEKLQIPVAESKGREASPQPGDQKHVQYSTEKAKERHKRSPVFMDTLKNQTVPDGSRVVLQCEIQCSPDTEVVWYK